MSFPISSLFTLLAAPRRAFILPKNDKKNKKKTERRWKWKFGRSFHRVTDGTRKWKFPVSVLQWEGVSSEIPWGYTGLLLLRAHKGIREVARKYLFLLTWNPSPSAFVCEGERISTAVSPCIKPRHKRRYDNIKIYLALKLQHAKSSTRSQTPCHVFIINVILASTLSGLC